MSTTPFAMNSFRGKQVLALVRGGDFAHAGEEEAIEMTMAAIPKDQGRHLLDAGCGRGGTAAYLQDRGWGQVTGIDIEDQSIAEAHTAYPGPSFVAGDILNIAEHVDRVFDVVTMFNVLYTVPDQQGALGALASVATPSAKLAIFDYVNLGGYRDDALTDALTDASGAFLPHPPSPTELDAMLTATGWQVTAFRSIGDDYARWYAALVDNIQAKRPAIEALAGADGYDHVHGLYSDLLTAIQDGRVGGAIVHARMTAA